MFQGHIQRLGCIEHGNDPRKLRAAAPWSMQVKWQTWEWTDVHGKRENQPTAKAPKILGDGLTRWRRRAAVARECWSQRTSPRWPGLTLAVTARQQPWRQWCSESGHHQRWQVRRPLRYRGMETGREVPLRGEQDNWGSEIYPQPSSQRDPGQIVKGSRLWPRLDASVRHLEAFSGSSLSWD